VLSGNFAPCGLFPEFLQPFFYALLVALFQKPKMAEGAEAEQGYAPAQWDYAAFLRVEFKLEFGFEKFGYFHFVFF